MDKMDLIAIVLVAIIVLMAGVLVGYTVKGSANGSAQSSPQAVADGQIRFYGINDNNTTIIVTENTSFAVILDENPTTGYRWNASHTDGLSVISDNYIPGDTDLSGAGGLHIWVIKATGHGTQSFNAVYARPWENATVGCWQFGMNVVIHDPEENKPV